MNLTTVTAILISLAAIVYCRQDNPILEDFENGPWVVKNAKIAPEELEGHRAHFTGVTFSMDRNILHGETEYRVFYNGIVAMETIMRRMGETDLFYREVTDGKKVIQLVYNGRQGLVDCDVERDNVDVDIFLAEFLMTDVNTVSFLRRERPSIDIATVIGNANVFNTNSTFQLLENHVLSEPHATLVDIDVLQRECIRLHHSMKHRLRENGINVDDLQSLADEKDQEYSEEITPRRVKRTKRSAQPHSRAKRDLLMPDTKWCGAGSVSSDFEDVGESRGTDRCCRDHDHCPYFIEGFSSNYNMFNYYLHTVSHCYCDETFRTCLKTAGTDKSEMVGKVFFSILGMKCFEFETEEVCVERSWWGRCVEHETQVVAHIRGSLAWN